MNKAQEEHIAWLLETSQKRIDAKYRAGDTEHGGPGLMAMSGTELLDHAIEESLDMLTYLLTLRRKADGVGKLPKRQTVWDRRSMQLREGASQIWQYLFDEPLPESVHLRWCPHLGRNAGQATIGAIHCGGVIQLDWSYLSKVNAPLAILVHEMAHARGFRQHNKKFYQHVNQWLERLSLPIEKKR